MFNYYLKDTENKISVFVRVAPNTYTYQESSMRNISVPPTFEAHYKSLLDPPVATFHFIRVPT
jgi:hypothetical protein